MDFAFSWKERLCTPLGEDQEATLLEGTWNKTLESNVSRSSTKLCRKTCGVNFVGAKTKEEECLVSRDSVGF